MSDDKNDNPDVLNEKLLLFEQIAEGLDRLSVDGFEKLKAMLLLHIEEEEDSQTNCLE